MPPDFYCDNCQKWTRVHLLKEDDEDGAVIDFCCSSCGESYTCGECGYEIDRDGNCQRPEGHREVGVDE